MAPISDSAAIAEASLSLYGPVTERKACRNPRHLAAAA
jgi:hypothetical protein